MCRSYKNKAKPFVKWAGGKGQSLDKFNALYPLDLKNGQIGTYIEPFVGGGAVLFDVLQGYSVKRAVVCDVNKELINCYRCIKTQIDTVISELRALQTHFHNLSEEEQSKYYLFVRAEYNGKELDDCCDYNKAARFIFLNKTCFNGLYRVNSKGEFNVPFGKYKNPTICDEENLRLVNSLLQMTDIYCGDYKECTGLIDKNTFVYIDPPYRPITATQSFVGYSANGFDDNAQIALSEWIKQQSGKGAYIMLSNSDPKNNDNSDNFFDELYCDFHVERISAKRMINCKGDKRGSLTEIVVRNYKTTSIITIKKDLKTEVKAS